MKTYKAATSELTATATPRRSLTFEGDVVVPFMQSLISGLVLAVLVTGVLWGFLGLDFAKTFMASLGLGLAISWLWRLDVVTQTLWIAEEFAHVDLDRDGSVGRPQPTIRLEIAQGNHTSYLDIEGLEDTQQLRTLAILGLTNRLNERMAKKEFDWPREHWQGVRDKMIKREWAIWGGGNESIRLTAEGQEIMREILNSVT